MVDNNVWTENYAPKELNEMILHPVVRTELENVLNNPQNIILYGSTGVGKGTFTKIFLDETGCDLLWKNASHDTGIDMIRNQVEQFANAASHKSWFDTNGPDAREIEDKYKNLKVVVFNEAENLSSEAQASLRELMERVERRCKFIFMTNNINKIDQAIKSRSFLIEIKEPPIADILRHMEKILDEEDVRYDDGTLATFVQNCYPDIRKTINEIKGHCNDNQLGSGEINSTDENVKKIFMDLRLHIAFYNLKRIEIYDKIKDSVEISISQKQFYDLLSGKNYHKVRETKKLAVANYIQGTIPVKKWLSDYMRLNE